jgi:hypothetical protein
MTPEPIAGLLIGMGAAIREPRFSFFVSGCFSLSDGWSCGEIWKEVC